MHRRIFIFVTTDCNLRCRYCYEHNKGIGTADIEKIKAALVWEFGLSEYRSIQLSFLGGEPFIEFNKIKDISEWVWTNFPNRQVKVDVSTNGTILTDDMRKWLKENEGRFVISISIDGRKKDHNKSRGNSFDLIDLPFFTSLKGVKAKMTISPDSVSRMMENYLYVKSLGFDTSLSLAQEVEWNNEQLNIYQQELLKFIDYQLENPDIDLLPFFRYNIQKFAPRRHGVSRWNCGAGYYEIAYDINGNFYPCHAYVSQFKEYDQELITSLMDRIENSSFNECMIECKDCVYKHVCVPCLGMNQVHRGAIHRVNPISCEIQKTEINATVKLYAVALSERQKYVWLSGKSNEELLDIINGIKYIASHEL